MFKSIQYKHHLFVILLVITVATGTYLAITHQYVPTIVCGILTLIWIHQLNITYRRYNENFNFLLNALDNGDYSFHFSTNKLSLREKELNTMMNWIKQILTNAKNEVIENESFLSTVMESVPIGILIIDERGIVQSVNKSTLDMLGMPIFTHINQLKSINESYPQLFRYLKKGDQLQIPVLTEKEEIQISVQVSEIKMKRGNMRVITLNNIGNELESKEMDSWIRLIRVMTHEIMNSIAPISSLSETMLSLNKDEDIPSEEIKQNTLDAFETIRDTASGLLSFVDSYRKFTAIPIPRKTNFNLYHLLDKVIQLYETQVKENNIEIQFEKENANFDIYADPSLLNQVLVNLMKNALEAVLEKENNNTGEGDKTKKIRLSAYKYEDGKTIINIGNTGQPISEDILPNIFIPFFTTKSSGSGIGLSVSRQIIRLHEGKLQHFVSPEGMTVFQISLNS
ncbi:MAG: PAS domain-containing protein [Bacteroidales bacterium]|nr:PAS domain-containing protein [Bacteroidales bacterium]